MISRAARNTIRTTKNRRMARMNKFLLVLVVCLFGCVSSSKYLTEYDTYLKGSETKSLQFKDNRFSFDFVPMPNGVLFTIINKTETPATLLWDHCYFIQPDGNSSKALNMDLLGENSETKEKAKYESVLPPNARFSRFTTSVLNTHSYIEQRYNSVMINQLFSGWMKNIIFASGSSDWHKFTDIGKYRPDYTGPGYRDSTNGIDTVMGWDGNKITVPHVVKKIDTVIKNIAEDAPLFQPSYIKHWDTSYKKTIVKIDTNLIPLTNYVINNNNMGIGFGISLNDTVLNYRFDFKFRRVTVNTIDSGHVVSSKSATEENNWQWK
jgi:hypothetical protein